VKDASASASKVDAGRFGGSVSCESEGKFDALELGCGSVIGSWFIVRHSRDL
jgi:hypothetical protein